MRHSQPISIGTCIESYINITSVLLVCGLPAAGKSTICSKVMSSDLVRTKYNEIIEVNYDRITVDISSKLKRQQADDAVEATGTDDGKMAGHHFTDIDLEAWRKTRTYALEHLESLFQRQKCDQQNVTRNSNTLIIVDDNFFLRSMRREVYKICQRHVTNHNMIGFSILHVDVPVEVCLKRNKSREGKAQVPDAVIERMATQFEIPNPQKTNWEIASITMPFIHEREYSDVIETLLQCVERGSDNPVRVPSLPIDAQVIIAQERARTSKSRVHRSDKILRVLVGAACKNDKRCAQNANKVKNNILDEVRSGNPSFEVELDCLSVILLPVFVEKLCSFEGIKPATEKCANLTNALNLASKR